MDVDNAVNVCADGWGVDADNVCADSWDVDAKAKLNSDPFASLVFANITAFVLMD